LLSQGTLHAAGLIRSKGHMIPSMLDSHRPRYQPSVMSLEKRYLRVETLPGDRVFGSFVIGVPTATVLDLKQQYPDRNFAGPNPKVDDAIRQSITEEEKRQIRKHLKIALNADFKFKFQGIGRPLDEVTEKPTFEGENGKKFWVIQMPS
jgi:hypothetical protein